MPAEASARRTEWFLALALCVLTSALRLLWPGDTQWINDEPLFLAKAAAINAGHGGIGSGLQGNVGLTYGPVAVWIFAALLRVSGDLLHVVMLRTLLWCALTSTALLWLARLSPRLRPLSWCLVLLSPYTWLYSRHLWDNTWLMPLGALSLAAYVAFHQAPARWRFFVAGVALSLALLIHPMVAPLALVLVGHALWMHAAWLRAHWKSVLILALVCLGLAAPWLHFLLQQITAAHPAPPPPPPPLSPPVEAPAPWWVPFLFPFLGGCHLSGQGIEYFLEPGWSAELGWVQPLTWLSYAAHGLVWLGLAIALRDLRRGWPARRQQDTEFQLRLLCVGLFAVQWLMHAILRRHTHPHYFNGAWIGYVYFVAVALSTGAGALWTPRVRAVVGGLLSLALVVLTATVAQHIHIRGGNRGIHFGATLQNQIDVARQLARYAPDAPLQIEVRNYLMFPHALPLLRALVAASGDPRGPTQPLRLRYRDPDERSGWILVETAPQ